MVLIYQHARHWLLWLALGFGFYMLLSDTYSVPEFMVGLGAAAMGATAATAVRARRQLRFGPDAGVLHALRPVPGRMVVDAVQVLVVLVQSVARGSLVSGRVRSVPMSLGGASPARTARRAVADYATCLTPMTLSFGYDDDDKALVIHELRRPGGSAPGPAVQL